MEGQPIAKACEDLENIIISSDPSEAWTNGSLVNVIYVCSKLPTALFGRLRERAKVELRRQRHFTPQEAINILSSIDKSDDAIPELHKALVSASDQYIIQGGFANFEGKQIGPLSWALERTCCSADIVEDFWQAMKDITGIRYLPASSLALLLRLISTRGNPSSFGSVLVTVVDYFQKKDIRVYLHDVRDSSMVLLAIGRMFRGWSEVEAPSNFAATPLKWNDAVILCKRSIYGADSIIDSICTSIYDCLAAKECPKIQQNVISSVLYSLALLQHQRSGLIQECIQAAENSMNILSLRSIATIAWSLSALRFDNEEIFEALAERLSESSLLDSLHTKREQLAQSISMILYAFSTMDRFDGTHGRELLSIILAKGKNCLPYLSGESLPKFGWALMVARKSIYTDLDNKNFVDLVGVWRSIVVERISEVPKAVLPMVHHVEIAIGIEIPTLGNQAQMPYDSLLESLYGLGRIQRTTMLEWNEQLASFRNREILMDAPHTISLFQRQVFFAVNCVLPGWTLEYWDEKLQYPVDMALPSRKLVVEADGPSHFTYNTKRPLGATSLKRRLLRSIGWTVIVFNYFEWDRDFSEEEQKLFVLKTFAVNSIDIVQHNQKRSKLVNPAKHDSQHSTEKQNRAAGYLDKMDIIKANQKKLSLEKALRRRILRSKDR